MKKAPTLLCVIAAALVFAWPMPEPFLADATLYVQDRTIDLGAKEMGVAYLSGATSGDGGNGNGNGDCPDPTPGFNCGEDEVDAFTVLLYHFDGRGQGGVGENYEDCGGTTYAPHNLGWRNIQNVVETASSAKFGDSGISLDGTAYFDVEDDYELWPRLSDFTIDFWARIPVGVDGNYRIIWASTGAIADFEAANHAGKTAVYGQDEAGWREATHADARDGAWHHVAIVRSGATLLCFFDGVKEVLDLSWGHDIWDNQGDDWEFGYDQGNQKLIADVDEFRYSIGIARWTEDFTPPTEAY